MSCNSQVCVLSDLDWTLGADFALYSWGQKVADYADDNYVL